MKNAKTMDGICTKCQEWTTVFEPCCNAAVIVDGSACSYEDYCPTCGDELTADALCERCGPETDGLEPP